MVNSKHLADGLSDLLIEERDILNSHDVLLLFTCTPFSRVLEIVKDRLEKEGFKEYNEIYDCNHTAADVIELLAFGLYLPDILLKETSCRDSPCFSFHDKQT